MQNSSNSDMAASVFSEKIDSPQAWLESDKNMRNLHYLELFLDVIDGPIDGNFESN